MRSKPPLPDRSPAPPHAPQNRPHPLRQPRQHILTAMRKDPARRYPRGRLCEDIRRYIEAVPSARLRAPWFFRATRFARRYRQAGPRPWRASPSPPLPRPTCTGPAPASHHPVHHRQRNETQPSVRQRTRIAYPGAARRTRILTSTSLGKDGSGYGHYRSRRYSPPPVAPAAPAFLRTSPPRRLSSCPGAGAARSPRWPECPARVRPPAATWTVAQRPLPAVADKKPPRTFAVYFIEAATGRKRA